MKVLMVCLGNICRSPMAEGILRSKVEKLNLSVDIDSCGTSANHVGEHPDNRAISAMNKKGIFIKNLRARKFSVNDFRSFDIIYTMDSSNYNDVLSLAKTEEHKNKVKMILNESFPGKDISVPDPYFGGDEGFEKVYNMLDAACDEIVKKLN